jgi:hypothetical protein
MFQPWERFNARKTASLMNKHRMTLRREHASLRKLLRQKSKDQNSADVSEQINSLQKTLTDALNDHNSVCKAMHHEFSTTDLARYIKAYQARVRLFGTSIDVMQTFHELGIVRTRYERVRPAAKARTRVSHPKA